MNNGGAFIGGGHGVVCLSKLQRYQKIRFANLSRSVGCRALIYAGVDKRRRCATLRAADYRPSVASITLTHKSFSPARLSSIPKQVAVF